MFIDKTVKHVDTIFEGDVKIFRNVYIANSKIGTDCSIGDDTTIERCNIESKVTINRRSYINDSFIDKFTYSGINTTINWSKIGRFCSLARNVDIGGFDHDYQKITTMPNFRFNQILNGGGKIPKQVVQEEYCVIGNDVWIAAGAIILHKVKIGNGAVVGAGAVVTKDVPSYAIVAGVPAKIIGYRCSEENIERLNRIKWWDMLEEELIKIAPIIINNNISDEMLDELENEIMQLRS